MAVDWYLVSQYWWLFVVADVVVADRGGDFDIDVDSEKDPLLLRRLLDNRIATLHIGCLQCTCCREI